jgi:uncharacterized DUF497 family protein
MILVWDQNKNTNNIVKHGIDFNDLREAFNNIMLIKRDDRADYGEDRFIGIGQIQSTVIVIVWTVREDQTRIISARKANKKEREIYYDKIN